MKRQNFLMLFALFIFQSISLGNPNLIVNGDFEAGNTGFITDYNYNATSVVAAGSYAINTNTANVHPLGWIYGDHTSGFGNMMIINGSTIPNIFVWEESIPVSQNTNYQFSLWLNSWSGSYFANIEFFINDISIGTCIPSYQQPPKWNNYSQIWSSGLVNTATIKLYDRELSAGGNDFEIDDISFTPVPAPAAIVLAGIGAGCVHWLRRKKTI
jgi:hypothetical protein